MSDPAVDGDAGDVPQGAEHVLPLQRDDERWLDLLAVLLATDPAPLCAGLGVPLDGPAVVRRGVGRLGRQPGLVLRGANGEAVVASALLVEPDVDRLRYTASRTLGARAHVLLTSRHLHLGDPPAPWRVVAWEDLLAAVAGGQGWAAATSQAWLGHANRTLPRLAPGSPWASWRDGEDVAAAMTARLSWVAARLRRSTAWDPLLVPADGLREVLHVEVPTARPGEAAVLRVADGLPAHRRLGTAGPHVAPAGPHVLVGLRQDVDAGRRLDWARLAAAWPLMAAARDDWDRELARPRAAADRRDHERAVARGLPPYVGRGPGDSEGYGSSLFGATFTLDPTRTMADVATELSSLAPLLEQMAAQA